MPSHTQKKPYPLRTAPKPSTHYRELTDAELAALMRRVVALDVDIRRLDQERQEKRREMEALVNQARLSITGSSAFVTEPCSLCGFIHTGSC